MVTMDLSLVHPRAALMASYLINFNLSSQVSENVSNPRPRTRMDSGVQRLVDTRGQVIELFDWTPPSVPTIVYFQSKCFLNS